jgi:hypothetical protein
MLRQRWNRLFAALVIVFGLTACDRGSDYSNHPTAPQSFLSGSTYGDYTLANDPLLSGLLRNGLSVTGLLGTVGGTLDVLGHTLHVPQGAVRKRTLFSVLALPGGYVEVDLNASLFGLLGGLLNIGEQGFYKPVTVTLSYERSTNIPDPTKLVIIRLNGLFGTPEEVPTRVDLENQTVSADLDHFSRYAIAFPSRR